MPLGIPRRGCAGIMLCAPQRCRICWWLASESNSASASTKRRGTCWAAASTNPGSARVSIHIGDHQPLQIVFIARLPTAVLLDAPEEVGADGLGRQSRAIHGGRNSPATSAPTPPPHRFSQPAIDSVVVQPSQEAKQRGVVRHGLQLQNFPQVAMLSQTYFGFAKGPVFVAHQTKDGQQLWLRELVFAETAPVGRQNRGGYIQSHAGKGQESDLWHPTSCLSRKHHPARFVRKEIAFCAEDVNRATLSSFRMNTYEKQGGRGVDLYTVSRPTSPACLESGLPIHTTLHRTALSGSSSRISSTACPRLSRKFPCSRNPRSDASTTKTGNSRLVSFEVDDQAGALLRRNPPQVSWLARISCQRRGRRLACRTFLRRRMDLGVISTNSSSAMNSMACSRLSCLWGIRRMASSALEERMLVCFFSFVTLTSMSCSREFSPRIMPS